MLSPDEVTAVIDRMEATRATNNVEWMAILRIAMREAPEETVAVIRKITKFDTAIQDDWRELAG